MVFQFKDISFSVGSGRCMNVSGGLQSGESLIVRGPSGAGKSTLLRILSRLQPCSKGEAYLKNSSWWGIPATTWRTEIHYVAQRPALFDGTVLQNLAQPFETSILKSKGKFDLNYAKTIINNLLLSSDLLDQSAKTLSGGEAARVAFARALLIEPSVLLLDEPTAALDSKARDAFYSVLSQWLSTKERAALLISHNNDYEALNNIKYLDINKEL